LAIEFPLVIAGKLAWDDGKTLAAIKQGIQDNRCIWLNYVSDYEKRCLLQSTKGLVFASLYEGFGLPILEAYASQTPVITSSCTSMPEIAGDASLIINPLDIEELSDALHTTIAETELISTLKIRGLEKAKAYTWTSVAQSTKEVYLGL
jgi:alpha-1,3-rhamnosyl/mannosyltransferase